MMKKILCLLAFISLSSAYAQDLRLIKVKELGVMKNKVIFQSLDVKKVKKTNVVKGKLIVQWGLEVFELVDGFYTCNTKNVCRLTDYERLATFKSCKVKNKKASCSQKLSADSYDVSLSAQDLKTNDNPDSVSDEFDNNRDDQSETDFPVRIQDEFSDIF